MSENILDMGCECVCKTRMKKDITLKTEVFKWTGKERIPGRRSTRRRQ